MEITQGVIEILEQCSIDGNKLFLPDIQLDRALYVSVNKVLVLAGGKWNRQVKAHLFTDDIGDLLDTLILSGEITDIKKELQYFATPPSIVKQLIDLAELQPEDTVLEPSAGTGAIAFEVAKINHRVTVFEMHMPFINILNQNKDLGCVQRLDFLDYQTSNRFDKIIANPPFTRQQDIDHVENMIDCCCGRVVSVMSSSVMWRDNKKTRTFRELIDQMGGRFIELPVGSFKESGTMVNACILVVDVS